MLSDKQSGELDKIPFDLRHVSAKRITQFDSNKDKDIERIANIIKDNILVNLEKKKVDLLLPLKKFLSISKLLFFSYMLMEMLLFVLMVKLEIIYINIKNILI